MTLRGVVRVVVWAALASLPGAPGWAQSPTGAFIWGDDRGKPERDCYIALRGYSAADLVPINKRGTKVGFVCTDCDPSCDRDGVAEANASCTFRIAVCVNTPGLPGCDPASRNPKKLRATAKSMAPHKVDLAGTLPSDGSPTCSDFVEFEVPLKGKTRNKVGTGKVVLKATKPMDKDVFRFKCEPRPAGDLCPTTTTSTSTTTTTICSGTFCDLGNGTVHDVATDLQWEQKTADDGIPDSANLHDVDNRYAWACNKFLPGYCQPNEAAVRTCLTQVSEGSLGPFGCAPCDSRGCSFVGGAITTIWDWINQVNLEGGTGFAGHNDWRLPTVRLDVTPPYSELETIVLGWPTSTCLLDGIPCIDAIFGPTAPSLYMTNVIGKFFSTPVISAVHFDDGVRDFVYPTESTAATAFVRAVRPVH